MTRPPHLVYLACPAGAALSAGAVAKHLPAIAPDMPATLETPEGPGARDSLFVEMEGVTLVVMDMRGPLPADAWADLAQRSAVWPEAADAMAEHRTHIVIAPTAPAADTNEAFWQAIVVSVLAATIAESLHAIGVRWAAGGLVEAKAFVDSVKQMTARGDLSHLPFEAWVKFDFGRMGDRYEALSRGLVPFLSYELAIVSDAANPADQAVMILDLAEHFMRGGAPIAEGDTVEIGPALFVAHWTEDQRLLRLE